MSGVEQLSAFTVLNGGGVNVLLMLCFLKPVRWLMVRAGKWAKIWQVAPRAPLAAARKRSDDGGGLELEA